MSFFFLFDDVELFLFLLLLLFFKRKEVEMMRIRLISDVPMNMIKSELIVGQRGSGDEEEFDEELLLVFDVLERR